MVSTLPETSTPNAIFSWLIYGMLAAGSYAVTVYLVGNPITEAVRKKDA